MLFCLLSSCCSILSAFSSQRDEQGTGVCFFVDVHTDFSEVAKFTAMFALKWSGWQHIPRGDRAEEQGFVRFYWKNLRQEIFIKVAKASGLLL